MKEDAIAVREEIQPANLLQAITRVATTPGLSIDVIERMLAMQERLEAKQAETAFARDMAMLQAELPQIQKDGRIIVRGTERSRYALHEDIDTAIRPILAKYGFSIAYDTDSKDGKVFTVFAKVSHREGHSETKTIMLPMDASEFRSNVQSIGSTISYAKRQLLGMHFNIVTKGSDDDGEGGQGFISSDQEKDLLVLIDEVKANKEGFLKYMRVEKLADIPAKEFKRACTALEDKRRTGK